MSSFFAQSQRGKSVEDGEGRLARHPFEGSCPLLCAGADLVGRKMCLPLTKLTRDLTVPFIEVTERIDCQRASHPAASHRSLAVAFGYRRSTAGGSRRPTSQARYVWIDRTALARSVLFDSDVPVSPQQLLEPFA